MQTLCHGVFVVFQWVTIFGTAQNVRRGDFYRAGNTANLALPGIWLICVLAGLPLKRGMEKDQAKKIIAVIDDAVFKAQLEEALEIYAGDCTPSFYAGAADIPHEKPVHAAVVFLVKDEAGAAALANYIAANGNDRVIAVCHDDFSGAVDVITPDNLFRMPLRLGALLSCIEKNLSSGQAVSGPVSFGSCRLFPADGLCVFGDGRSVRLTEKEKEIFIHLYDRRDQVIDRKDLLDAVWGFAEGVETHTLETHIYRLRQKIEEDPASPQILITDGTGYRLSVS